MSATGSLTIEVLEGYLQCRYLGFLHLAGRRGEISEYAALLGIRRAAVRAAALEKIVRESGDQAVTSSILLTSDVLRRGAPFLFDADLQRADISIRFDGLQRAPGASAF